MEEKIKEVLSDETYIKSLLTMNSYEDVRKSLEEKDIDISVKDLRKIHELLIKRVNGELTDKDLEEVAGGMFGVTACLLIVGVPTVLGFMSLGIVDAVKRC